MAPRRKFLRPCFQKKRNAKRPFFYAALLICLLFQTGCDVQTSRKIDIDPAKIQYAQDKRTGLCFGFIASKRPLDPHANGLGIAHVPCTDEVLSLIEK